MDHLAQPVGSPCTGEQVVHTASYDGWLPYPVPERFASYVPVEVNGEVVDDLLHIPELKRQVRSHRYSGAKWGIGLGMFDFMVDGEVYLFCCAPHKHSYPDTPTAMIPAFCVVYAASKASFQRLVDSVPRHRGANMIEVLTYCPTFRKWIHAGKSMPRDSVTVSSGAIDALMTDVADFADEKTAQWYAERGIPHKRGYMLHGPPGCGKTSTIRCIASKLGVMALHTVKLSNPSMRDAELHNAVQVDDGNGSDSARLYVFEDLDCLFDVDRNPVSRCIGCTFSGLLNALDGVQSTRMCIFIFTTNHPERIDAALQRPGRVDRKFKFDFMTRADYEHMFLRFYVGEVEHAREFARKWFVPHTTGAMLQEHFIANRRTSATDLIRVQPMLDTSPGETSGMYS